MTTSLGTQESAVLLIAPVLSQLKSSQAYPTLLRLLLLAFERFPSYWEIQLLLLLIVIVQELLMIKSMEHWENVYVSEENIHSSVFLESSAVLIVMIAVLIVSALVQKTAMSAMKGILIQPLDAQSVIVLVLPAQVQPPTNVLHVLAVFGSREIIHVLLVVIFRLIGVKKWMTLSFVRLIVHLENISFGMGHVQAPAYFLLSLQLLMIIIYA